MPPKRKRSETASRPSSRITTKRSRGNPAAKVKDEEGDDEDVEMDDPEPAPRGRSRATRATRARGKPVAKRTIPNTDTEDEDDEMDVDGSPDGGNSKNSEDDEDLDEDWAAPRKTETQPKAKAAPKRKAAKTTPKTGRARGKPAVKPKLESEDEAILVDDGEGSPKNKDKSEEVTDVSNVSTGVPTGEITSQKDEDGKEEDDSDEDIDWEDALPTQPPPPTPTPGAASQQPIRDLELTIEQNEPQSVFKMGSAKKKTGISAVERRMRLRTHTAHVEYQLKYGLEINKWLNDKRLQDVMVGHLTKGLRKDVESYKKSLERTQTAKPTKSPKKPKGKGGLKRKDEYESEEEFEEEASAASDPLVKLIGILLNFWKKRFKVTAPGLRKVGYPPAKLSVIEDRPLISLFDIPGRPKDFDEFLELASKCEGSRDTGEQLFTGLLRGLGLDTRMVFSLQPLGFAFSVAENAFVEEEKEDGDKEGENGNDTKEEKKPSPKATPRKPQPVKSRKTRDLRLSIVGSDEELESDDDDEDYEAEPEFDPDLAYPVFWTEIYSPTTLRFYAVDPLTIKRLITEREEIPKFFEPKGKAATQSKQVICYVVAFSDDNTAKDVTVRYLNKNMFPGKTKGLRLMSTRQPIYDVHGEIIAELDIDWFEEVMNRYRRKKPTERDKKEDEDLQPHEVEQDFDEFPDSIQGYKNHPKYVLRRHLYRDEGIPPDAKPVHYHQVGKDKTEPVYRREDVLLCKTIENWYREGRVIKETEEPLKSVHPRAATINRKREIEANKKDGIDVSVGLWAEYQTELYKAPPVVDGKVPRNGYGNCDLYVPSMVPPGGVHLPLKGSKRIAQKLGVDAADAVVGFEFAKKRALPILDGVVVPAEMADVVRDAWRADQAEKQRKADTKRQAASLDRWRRFLMRLRVVERMNEDYTELTMQVESNPFVSTQKRDKEGDEQHEEEGGAIAGGFIVDGDEEGHGGGGFLSGNKSEDTGGGFLVSDNEGEKAPRSLRGSLGGGGFLPESDAEDDHGPRSLGGGFMADSDAEEAGPSKTAGGGFLADSDAENAEPPKPLGGGFIPDSGDEDVLGNANQRRRRRGGGGGGGGFIHDTDDEDELSPPPQEAGGFVAEDDQPSSHPQPASPGPASDIGDSSTEHPTTVVSSSSSPLSSPPSTPEAESDDEYEEHSKFFPADGKVKESEEGKSENKDHGFAVVINTRSRRGGRR
ncbi:Rad4-domain-containing protein [Ascobolus immersus RN42]|uniref:Rad4-domain-containing protein n=1 Tax=Ascobolus immersus RN42 TaxID=1160509 RepID=A0A3N4IL94_ASCIM|nr:Rad4-domain-containing protein [Ascobolus immersus RN42]